MRCGVQDRVTEAACWAFPGNDETVLSSSLAAKRSRIPSWSRSARATAYEWRPVAIVGTG